MKDGEHFTPELENVITEYTAKYLQIRVVPLKQNQGLGKALNEGLKHCSYDLVARMDTDDIAKPNRFEKQIRVFQEHPELDVVGAWIDEFEETTSNIISTRKLPEVHDDICQFAKKRNPENHPVIMFRKQAVLAGWWISAFPSFLKIIIYGYVCYRMVRNFIISKRAYYIFVFHQLCLNEEVA